MSTRRIIANRFEIANPERDLLGRGGMGNVYRGADTQTGEPVAIKVLKPEVVADHPDLVARFVREGEALRQLNHPNIVQMIAAVEEAGRHYLVVEYVAGGSLQDLLDKQGPLPVARVVEISLDVADALTRAHRLGIVHRDLKPANVLLAEDGTPRLTDFGVAHLPDTPRLTQAGAFVGTLDYLCPEACQGETLDGRADIWAFGVMLYEMLSGERPFTGATVAATLTAILTRPVLDLEARCPEVPAALVDLVYRMLEKDRQQRIPSVRLVGAELEAILQEREIVTPTPRPATALPLAKSRFATPTPSADRPRQPRVAHNLPVQATPFVGREPELAELARLLDDLDVRLVTILGAGGMGKTRLALEVGARTLRRSEDVSATGPSLAGESTLGLRSLMEPARGLRFEHGVYFVSLAPLRSVEAIVPTTAEAIGFSFYTAEEGGAQVEPRRQLLDYLRQKRMLLIMDNFEHLLVWPGRGQDVRGLDIRGDGVDLVIDILKTAPDVKILSTSRVRLNVQGEQLFHLAGMDFPDWETPGDAAEYTAARLFLQSARRVRPDFELVADDLTYLTRICCLVEGMPLAIELAGSWVDMLSLADIAGEIQSNLDFLETEQRDVPARHRSIRAVFDTSWQQLNHAEQALFPQLSVFRGGFAREAAEQIATTRDGAPASLRLLVRLANKSLLQYDRARDRYDIHELLRRCGAEKLATDPEAEAAVHDRHSAHYLAFVGERTTALRGDEPQRTITEIQAEIANVRQAWQWTVSQIDAGQDPVPYVVALGQCTQGLVQFYTQAGLFREGEQAFRTAAGRARTIAQDDETPSPERLATVLQTLSKLLAALGYFLACLGDHSTALAVFQEADAAYARAALTLPDTDLAERAMLLVSLGTSCNRVGDYTLAMQHLEAGLALARRVNAARVEITALSTLAQVASEQGAYDTAKQRLDEMLSLARACDDRTHVASALAMLGTIVWRWGDIEQADRCIQESLAIYKELGNRYRIPRILNVLGILAILRESYDQGAQYWEEGLNMAQEMGDRQTMADMLNNLGYINHHHLGNLEKAKQYYTESLSIGQEIGHRHGATSTLSNLGHLHVLLGEHELAWSYLRKALNESTAIGVAPLTLDALVGVARLRAETGQGDSAAELLGVALNHPAVEVDSVQVAETVLAGLREALPAKQLEAAMERGKTLELDAVVAGLLAEE